MAKVIAPNKAPLQGMHPVTKKEPVNVDSIEAMTPETDKKVYGSFMNIESPGQSARVCGKYYRGMQYFEKTFRDQERCQIPLSVARFINERCHFTKHKFISDKDETGNPMRGTETYPRYKFIIEGLA